MAEMINRHLDNINAVLGRFFSPAQNQRASMNFAAFATGVFSLFSRVDGTKISAVPILGA